MIRVGRIVFNYRKLVSIPQYEGFTSIKVMTPSFGEWYVLNPYELKDEKGRIMENCYQFSKIYKNIPKITRKEWKHPAETHIDANGDYTPEFYAWRKKGMEHDKAVRYPVGFKHRTKCLYALAENPDGSINEDEKLDYVSSRKKIYVHEYCRLVKEHPKFKELQERLNNGENLLILEVDGPHQESLDYYKEKYGVSDDFIQDDTILINEKNINIMLNDTKHPFGHGYCLAMALLNKSEEWNK